MKVIRTLNIGGEERPIDFNFNCLEEFQERTGLDPLSKFPVSIKTVKVLIFLGLKYGLHPDGCDDKKLAFTVKTIGSWLSAEDVVNIMKAYESQGERPEKKSEDLNPDQLKSLNLSPGMTSGESASGISG
jgi:hypothetical protein